MNRRQFGSFALLLLLGSLIAACSFFAPRKPSVVIISPSLGSQYENGQIVTVQSTATDPSGIVRIDLEVDGNVVHSDSPSSATQTFNATQTWQATGGEHTLSVIAYNTSNVPSDPAIVQVAVSGTPAPAGAPTFTLVTPAAGQTPSPAAQSTRTCSDDAAFVADVTVPDGSVIGPRQSFDKIWRVRNSGTCAWGPGYQLAFAGGEMLIGPTAVDIPATQPGSTAEIAVSMAAPAQAGTFTSYWRLRNPTGTPFGVTVSVMIRVSGPGAAPSCSGTPSISSFAISPTSITAGQGTTLSWGFVSNAESADIDNGVGGVATPGSTVVHPTKTTTYTLTATCGNNSATRQVTVDVAPAPANSPAPTATPPGATPTRANPTATPAASATPTAGPTTSAGKLTRCFTPNESGEAVKADSGRVASPDVQFGDDTTNSSHRALVTFDVPELSGKTITSGTLAISSISTLSNPYSLGAITIETVSYTPPVSGSDYDIGGNAVLNITAGLVGQYDIKGALQDTASAHSARFQLRFRFAMETNGNNVSDMIYWTSNNAVCINAAYH